MLKFASTVGLAYGAASLKRRIRAAINQAILASIGLVFVLGAAAFGLVALHLWLAGEIGPVASAGLIASVLLVIGIVFALAARRPRGVQPRAEDPGEQLQQTLQQGYARLARAGREGSPLTNPVVLGMAAALLAGILLGRRRS